MRKRSLSNSGLEDLGVSEFLLRDLDIAKGIGDDVNEAIDLTAGVREVEASFDVYDRVADLGAGIKDVEASLDAAAGRAGFADIETADASIRAWNALVSRNTVKIAGDSIADARATLNRANTSFGMAGLRNIAAVPMFPSATQAMLGWGPRPPMFKTLVNPSREVSGISTIVQRIEGLVDAVTPRTPNLLSATFNVEPNWSAARVAFSILGPGQRRSSLFPEGWQGGFASMALDDIFGATEKIARWSAAAPLKDQCMLELYRKADAFGASVSGIMDHVRCDFDFVVGRHLNEIFDLMGRIDWDAFERSLRVREARRPRTKIGYAALNAYDELYMGHPWVADRFLIQYLGIQPNHDRREALWRVLRWAFERNGPYPARWIVLDDERAAVYLRAATYREAKRVRRDQEMPNRVWWTERDPETKKKIELPYPVLQPEYNQEFMAQRSETPEHVVIGSPDERVQTLELLYFEGTEKDKRIVGMLIDGLDLPAIADVVGWPEIQRFQRKAQRWIRIKL